MPYDVSLFEGNASDGGYAREHLQGMFQSGLYAPREVYLGYVAIGRITFEKGDIVRHPLVQQIVEAYDAKARDEQEEEKKEPLINRDTDSL